MSLNTENTIFTPIRGTESEIFASNNKIEGGVYFAYDTKRIFYGHRNDNNNVELIPMGGNSGIYYGLQENLDESNDNPFFFDLQHLDHSESSGLLKLNKGDLILNIPNGIFYKVIGIQVSEDDIRYSTERLTVAGSGGGSGQGGGTVISGILTAYNIDGWSGKYLLTGSKIEIPFTFSALYNTGDPFDGNVTISVIRPGSTGYQINNVIRVEGVNTLSQTYKYNGQKTMTVNLDVSSLFPSLNRAVTTLEDITIEVAANFGDANTITKNRTITVSIVSVATEWSSIADNNTIVYDYTQQDFETNYNFYGSGINYYVNLYLNGEWVSQSDIFTASANNPKGQFIIEREKFNEFKSGFYSAELRFYAKSNNSEDFSLVGSHEGFLVLCSEVFDKGSVILGTSFNLTTVKQYDNITLPIFIYYVGEGVLPALSFSTPTGTITKTDWSNRSWTKFNYSFQEAGEQEFNFVCGNSSLTISIMVSEEQIGLLGTEVANYGFKFLPNSFIDNSQILNWEYDDLGENVNFSFSESFDWINGGLQSHMAEDGSLYFSFKIKAGNKVTVPLSLFSQTTKNNYIRDHINKNSIDGDAGSSGRSFKLIFETSNCSNVDEPFFKWTGSTGYDSSNSIILTPLKGKTLIGDSSADSWWIDNERIEFEINITNTNIEHSYLTTWIDGTPETITRFASEPNFNNFLTIGSETCDVDIYLMKAYYRTLSSIEHLYNFIADSLYSSLKIDRFQRNNILNQPDDIFSVSVPALLQKNKNCIVHHCIIPQLPQAKLKYKGTGKHNASSGVTTDVKYRQYRDGYVDRPYIQHDDSVLGVQGTSSFNYLLSAANLDIDFKWEPFKDSYGTSITEDNENIPNITDNGTKYKMSSTSIGEKYFNIKVNVASAENVNNALLADLYYKYNPFKSVAVQQDAEGQTENLHRDTIEFTNGLLFISDLNETKNDTENKLNNNLFKEYEQYMNLSAAEKENAPQFYAICNFGNSKKNEDIFHREDELCMEIKTNDNPVVTFEKDYEEVFAAAREAYEENPESNSEPVGTGNRYMDFANDKSFMIENCFEFRYHPKDEIWKKSVQRVQAEDPESEDGLAWQIDDEGNRVPIYKDNDKTILEQQYEKWDNFVQWMISNNPATATNELFLNDNNEPIVKRFSQFTFSQEKSPWLNRLGIVISRYANKDYDRDSYEYRMAKMLSECEDHIAMDSLVYHYLFLERFTLIDNVAKNTFWSSNKDSNYTIWDISKDYDNDTGVGINNSGFLKFDYGAECRDNPNIFNGSYHNAWFTFLNGISNDLIEAYKDLDTIIKRKDREEDYSFLKESTKWQNSIPEVCWILDAYRKYQRPYDIYEDSSYLKRLDGGRRKYQRKYYVTYQENYLASKYQIASNIMDLRCRPKSADYGLFIKLRQKGYLNYKLSKSSGAYSSIRVIDPSQYQLIADASAFGADLDENSDGVIFTLTNIDLIEKIGLNDNSIKESFNYQGPGVYEDLLFNDAPFAGCPNISTIVINNTLEEDESARVRYNAITLPVKNSLVKEIYASNLKSESPIAIDLSTSTSLTFLNLSKSNIYNIQIAKGAPIQTMILPQLATLNLNTLKRLEFISLDSFDSLKTLLINDIDDHKLSFNINNETTKDIYPSQYLFEQIYNQINDDNIFCLQKINWTIDSSSILNQNITADSIPFLDVLLTKKFRQIDKSDIVIGQSIVPYFSGTITFTDEVYSTEDSINLYNKYILGINQDEETASLHNLDLKFDNTLSKLYTCKVYNGDNNVYWERKYSPFNNITNTFLNKGIISSERIGSFNINDIVKADDPDNTYHFNEENAPKKWKIKYNNIEIEQTGDLIDILLNLINGTSDLAADINIYPIFTARTKTYSITIATLDSKNETILRTETLTRLNIDKPTEDPVPIIRTTPLDSILNAISYIPYLTDPNEENQCWIWTGISYEKNRFADPITVLNAGGITKNLTLYATFKEVEIGSEESVISPKYFNFTTISTGDTRRTLGRKATYSLGGKIVLPATDFNGNPVVALRSLNYEDVTHIYFSNDFTTTLQTIGSGTFSNARKLIYFDFKHFNTINRIDSLAFYNTDLNADCAKALGSVAVTNFGSQCFYDAFNKLVQDLYIKMGASNNDGTIINGTLGSEAFYCSDPLNVNKNKFIKLIISRIDNLFNGNRTNISGSDASAQPFNTITNLQIYTKDLNNIIYGDDKIFKENYMSTGVVLNNPSTLKGYLCESLVSGGLLNIGNIEELSSVEGS